MLKIHSDVKLVKAVLYIIFFLLTLNSLKAEELSEGDKKSLSLVFYIQTSGEDAKFTKDLNDNVVLKNVKSKPHIGIHNCFLTDFHRRNSDYEEYERLIGQENNALLQVSSIYKSLNIDHLREISKQTTENWLISNKVPHKSLSLSCKRDESGQSDLSFYMNEQVLVIPKYLEPVFMASIYKNRFTNIFSEIVEIKYDELVNKSNLITSNKQKIKDEKKQLSLSYSNAKNKSSIGGLILNLPSDPNSYVKKLSTCTASYKDANAARVSGYRLLGKSILPDDMNTLFKEKKIGLLSESQFDEVFKDVNDAYLKIVDKRTDCSFYIDYAENISKLKKGLFKKKIPSGFTKIISNQTTENKYAVSKGFTSANERNFIIEIGGNLKLAKELRLLKIDNTDKFNLLLDEIKQSGYEDNPTVNSVLIYLSDKKGALSSGIGINVYKTQRVAKAKQAADKRRKDAQVRKRKFAEEHPYEAVMKCGFDGSHASLPACFSGGKYGADTSLEIKNGSFYKLYKPYEIASSNFENTSNGVIIPLKKNFSITAQNASDTLTLTVIVRDTVTKKTLFEKSAAKFGVIEIKN